jgi:hypothetical protein
MVVTASSVDIGPQWKVRARVMYQLKQFIDVTVPTTDTDNLVGAAWQAFRVPETVRAAHAFLVLDGARVGLNVKGRPRPRPGSRGPWSRPRVL